MSEENFEQPKPKNPLDALPKSNFNLEEFKRVYSNEDTKTVSIPYFWKNFDKEGFSIWRADYKHNEELQLVFMSCNLIGGMFQRLESFRKYGFASVCVFGENNKSEISGVWIVRGQDLPFNESNIDWNDDAPLYTWTKLNPDDEKDREVVNEFLAWEGPVFTEKKFAAGKVYK